MLDLNVLDVNQENLLKYSSTLDNITKAVQDENKKDTLYYLADLYNLLVQYSKEYSENTILINVLDTKSNILYAYSLIEDSNWNEIESKLKQAQSIFNNIRNSEYKNTKKATNINKAYVYINELLKNVYIKNKDIFYINYKNLMQELEIIEN